MCILLLSHCLLNQRVRAKGLSPQPEVVKKIAGLISRIPVEVYQLPCPEFTYLGEREKMTYDEYLNLPGFKEHCDKLASQVKIVVERLGLHPLFIGVAGSPSCSLSRVKIGEEKIPGVGLFMESLGQKIGGELVEFDYDRVEKSLSTLEKRLKKILG